MYELFDWPQIILSYTQFIHFDENKQSAQSNSFYTSPTEIESIFQNIDKISEIINLEEQIYKDYICINPDLELKGKINKINKGASIDLDQLNQVVLVIEFFTRHQNSLKDFFQFVPDNQDRLFSQLNKSLLNEFRTFIQKDGKIDYFKHPMLNSIHNKIIETEKNINQKVSKAISQDFKDVLQINSYEL